MPGFNLFRLQPLAEFLPEVQSPTEDVPFRRKAEYTAGLLLVFFASSQLPLFGIDTTMAADDPLFWPHTAYAANLGTVMALGVFPLVVSEVGTHVLLGLKAVNPTVENRIILNGLQKVLGVLISVVMPVGIALSLSAAHLSMGSTILASLQISIGGVVVIYLDEVLRKGYGLLAAIPGRQIRRLGFNPTTTSTYPTSPMLPSSSKPQLFHPLIYSHSLADVARDPVYACLYAALLLFGCGLVSMAWFRVCIHSKSYMNRLVGDQVSVTPAQADSIPLSQWARRVFMVAFAVGFCVGAGVIGSGTGIMLAVTVMHSYFDGGASSGIGPIGL
ncbi:hypothetical protein ACQ4PT_042697 [Festuca glaucescens]